MYNPNRAYQATKPTASALLQKRWDERNYRKHREKVAIAKPYVDNRSPKTYLHLHQRLKKYVMEEHRLALIQRDNYTLLTKMAAVMQGKGIIDNWNDYRIMSLNGALRQRIQLRIAQENQAILARIEAARPHYNPNKWERDWVENKAYRAYIAKYPHAGTFHAKQIRMKGLDGKERVIAHTVYWPGGKLR